MRLLRSQRKRKWSGDIRDLTLKQLEAAKRMIEQRAAETGDPLEVFTVAHDDYGDPRGVMRPLQRPAGSGL